MAAPTSPSRIVQTAACTHLRVRSIASGSHPPRIRHGGSQAPLACSPLVRHATSETSLAIRHVADLRAVRVLFLAFIKLVLRAVSVTASCEGTIRTLGVGTPWLPMISGCRALKRSGLSTNLSETTCTDKEGKLRCEPDHAFVSQIFDFCMKFRSSLGRGIEFGSSAYDRIVYSIWIICKRNKVFSQYAHNLCNISAVRVPNNAV